MGLVKVEKLGDGRVLIDGITYKEERAKSPNKFTLFWLTGKSEIITGYDAVSAMNNAGYGAGSLKALDFHAKGDARKDWSWNKFHQLWSKVTKEPIHTESINDLISVQPMPCPPMNSFIITKTGDKIETIFIIELAQDAQVCLDALRAWDDRELKDGLEGHLLGEMRPMLTVKKLLNTIIKAKDSAKILNKNTENRSW